MKMIENCWIKVRDGVWKPKVPNSSVNAKQLIARKYFLLIFNP